MRHLAASLLLLALGASSSTQVPANFGSPWPPLPAPGPFRDELVVLTRPSPTTRYPQPDGRHAGLEHDLATGFAEELGVPLRFIEARSVSEVVERLARGEAHLAAAGLAPTGPLRERFRFGPGYMNVRQIVVQRRDAGNLRSVHALQTARVVVASGSSGAEHLARALGPAGAPGVERLAADNPEDVTGSLLAGEADYAVTSSHFFDLVRTAFPMLTRSLPVGRPETLAWALPRGSDPELMKQVRRYFRHIAADGTLARLVDRYYGHVKRLDALRVVEFLDAIGSDLPRFRRHFEAAQQATGIDWRLIAALGFQESKWEPQATSPTGVRGLMMLTADTAARLGLGDRLDARRSILAGARYLRDLRDRLPERIPEPDRTWLALAAYNQGLGHLEDARVLTQTLGLNPDAWIDVKQALPRLADPEVYESLKHGYARGGEAMALTENVRAYYQILVQLEDPWTQTPAAADDDGEREREAPEQPDAMYL
ncbi:MAG: membrane-bound lytic murein transglycosylase MltF [Burkholderiales bacterium]